VCHLPGWHRKQIPQVVVGNKDLKEMEDKPDAQQRAEVPESPRRTGQAGDMMLKRVHVVLDERGN
jgi:hypothetical protein